MDLGHSAFLAVMAHIREQGSLNDCKIFLDAVIPEKLTKSAFSVITQRKICCFTAKASRRELWVVGTDSDAHNYAWITDKTFFCSCSSFGFNSVRSENSSTPPFCKHLVAISICQALSNSNNSGIDIHFEELEDDAFACLMEETINEGYYSDIARAARKKL